MTDPVVIDFDFETLTLGELCDIEDATGVDAMAAMASGKPTPKLMTAIVWVIKRRDNPEFSFDDAKKLRIADIGFDTPGDDA